jgi:hypothetical protein
MDPRTAKELVDLAKQLPEEDIGLAALAFVTGFAADSLFFPAGIEPGVTAFLCAVAALGLRYIWRGARKRTRLLREARHLLALLPPTAAPQQTLAKQLSDCIFLLENRAMPAPEFAEQLRRIRTVMMEPTAPH